MFETTLKLIILVLAILDVALIAALMAHHSISTRRRAELARMKEEWKAAFHAAMSGAGPRPELADAPPRIMAVAGEALRELLAEANEAEYKAGAKLFFELGLRDFYLERLESRLWWRRGEAALALGEARSEEDMPAIAHAIGDRFLAVRLKAATGLADLATVEAVEYLVDHIDALGFVSLQWLKDTFFAILKDKPEFASELLERKLPMLLLKAVVEMIGDIPDFSESGSLAGLLADDEQPLEIRISAVKSLGKIGKEQAAIVKVLTSSSDWEMRAAAANALALIGDLSSVSALEKGISDESWWVRVNSATALARLGKQGLEVLRANLTAPDKFARDIAKQTLAEAAMVTYERAARG